MKPLALSAWLATAVLGGVLAVGATRAQTDDVFAFIPDGGRTLLLEMAESGPADALQSMLAQKQDSTAWQSYLDGNAVTFSALQDYDGRQRQTLAEYLAFALPLEETGADGLAERLPMDGRDLALQYCQSCHIITVVITQDRTREAWLGTMHKPSHIEIELTEAQREKLADYLVLNAGIPIDDVPEALRAGGASY